MIRVALAICLAAPVGAWAHPGIAEVLSTLERDAPAHENDPDFALQQATAYRIAGDFDGALDAVAHAEAHGARARDVAFARADVFAAAGWLRSARRHLDRLADETPGDPNVLLRRARVLARQGEPAAAARDYATALAAADRPAPDHFVEHRDALVAAGDVEGALAALDAGIARLGPTVSLELPAAALALDLGRVDDALARVDLVLKQSPENPLLLARRGEILQRAGRGADAHAAYARALAALERRPRRLRSPRATALEHEIRTALGELSPRATEEAR